jgi:outer membrane protein TolC
MGLLEQSLNHLNLILNNMEKLENTTQNMVAEGYAKKVDILEVHSKQANVRRIITELEANKELLYHYLSFLLNQNVTEVQTPKDNLNVPVLSIDEILNQSIDIQKAQTALHIYNSKVTVEESRYLPTVGAIAEIQTADDHFLNDAEDHKSYTVGVRLTWNIFGGGGDSAAIEKAQIEKLKSQTQVELAKKGIALHIKEIQTNIKLAQSQIDNLKIELSLAQEIYKNYEGRYKEQLISMNDVIIKQSIWLENILQLLKANNKRNQQIFALEKLAQLGDTHD